MAHVSLFAALVFSAYAVLVTKEGSNMSASAKLLSNSQIAIPEAILQQQHWTPGQELAFIPASASQPYAAVANFSTTGSSAAGRQP